ncbi:uncharacterized protein THITE_2142122 [Thermothielavioides terrestris NRRL 8126]|uniref:Velvet domain-containing protein n=1 Tax=Thermothielavioides terrestris (strain ATCC 38088 / NRRL 8126) TaxID=578455 RepID=G2QRB9_THETT|nr:uncharacterized protein THITE_2142122 [Thermothielavioides terrestris NRRL 8126]AEO64171.1 hypothetical protein THITE_2142122 [Thermothielavioides terrestris NRRL 8126]
MMPTLGGGDFELAVRQQPKYACVAIERKPIDPPPIVQLMVNPRKDPARTFLQNPYLILTARLIRKGDDDPDDPSGPKESDLTGTLVSSLYSLKDTDNTQGGFFVFGDLSVRRVGTYRLAFILYELKLAEKECWLLSRTVSDPFVVYATKTFPGLAESTFLTRSFSDQGVRLRLRKDSRTVSTKKRSISQAEQIRASQGIHGYLPHDASHDLSPTGHSPHHHLRRISTLQDPGIPPGHPLDRSRSSMGSQGSYYTDSPQLRSAGDYTPTSYGYTTAGYDDAKPPHKRARMDGTSLDSPHAGGYDTDPATTTTTTTPTSYHNPYHHPHHPPPAHAHTHHPHPRTVPDPLTSLYPLATPPGPTHATTSPATTSYNPLAALSTIPPALPTMPSPYTTTGPTILPPRLDTSHLPPHSPVGAAGGPPGSATSTAGVAGGAFSPHGNGGGNGGGGGSRRSPAGYAYAAHAHHAFASPVVGVPFHPAAAAAVAGGGGGVRKPY